MSQILDGRKLRDELAPRLIRRISELKTKPKLVIIQIGSLEESNTYIKTKIAIADKIGVDVVHKKYAENVREAEVVSDISKYNGDPSVHGIMVQLPISAKLNTSQIVEAIDEKKDVDGLTAKNTKLIFD